MLVLCVYGRYFRLQYNIPLVAIFDAMIERDHHQDQDEQLHNHQDWCIRLEDKPWLVLLPARQASQSDDPGRVSGRSVWPKSVIVCCARAHHLQRLGQEGSLPRPELSVQFWRLAERIGGLPKLCAS